MTERRAERIAERKRKRRFKRRERRRKWIKIHSITMVVIAVIMLGLFLINNKINEATYVEYKESSNVNYSVKIPKNAPFYSDYLEEFAQYADENGDLWIPADHAYPTMVATIVRISIDYHLEVCSTDNVEYQYVYRISAQPEIVDRNTDARFPMPKTIIEESETPIKGNSQSQLDITKNIEIDYHYYDDIVKTFEEKMNVHDAVENLIITMEVEVVGSSEVFESKAENTCTIKVDMPLNANAFDVNFSQISNHLGDCRILCKKVDKFNGKLRDVMELLVKVEIALIAIFALGLYLTRNRDIAYYTKVQRLVNSYRSFIQKVEGEFDTTGYQIVTISSFREMLEIRDTIQSPILMIENYDKTRCQFFIPTNTKILYLFEVKVAGYDKLYRKKLQAENVAVADAPVVEAASAPVSNVTYITNNTSISNVTNAPSNNVQPATVAPMANDKAVAATNAVSKEDANVEKIDFASVVNDNVPAPGVKTIGNGGSSVVVLVKSPRVKCPADNDKNNVNVVLLECGDKAANGKQELKVVKQGTLKR